LPWGPRYPGLRLQIDPLDPPPRRDVRWILITLGAAFLIIGGFLLAVGALVEGVVPRGGPDPGLWLAWSGAPFLVLGSIFFGVGLVWALRPRPRVERPPTF
jgi:hypothetical protein